jgi:MYXO-CTERM domain-containing protein
MTFGLDYGRRPNPAGATRQAPRGDAPARGGGPGGSGSRRTGRTPAGAQASGTGRIGVKWRIAWLSGAILWGGAMGGCGDHGALPDGAGGARRAPVVYGNDDRRDVFEYSDQSWAGEVSGFTVALMEADAVAISPQGSVSFQAKTLVESRGVCTDERFADQLTAAYCSGTLIAPDLVLTAGHCVTSASECANTKLVFGYEMDGPGDLAEVAAADVFSCAELLVQELDTPRRDHAILRLDRPAGRESARLATGSDAIAVGTPLLVHGYPSGLPTKIDDGGHVRNGRATARDFFVASLDTFGGNSGSGVFDGATRQLVGILVRGDTDYVFDDADGCYRVNRCAENGCGGESISYAFRAIDALCATGFQSPLCPCGDGQCDASLGETTATCPADCGTGCPDGVCNGAESPVDCPEDCGTCGNAVCDDGEGEDQDTCCTDCGCAAPMVCAANACVPDPADGDTCANVADLRVTGAYTVPGDTTGAANDYRGECVLNTTGPDRVYGITLAEETWVDAQVSGYDTVLYVRTACNDPGSETLCVDDSNPPGGRGSRIAALFAPGTHYMFVDGRPGVASPYQLGLEFIPVRLASNDTCAAPASIPGTGSQTVTATLGPITGRNDYRGTCGGDGTDHVYRFTTSERTGLIARVRGIDSVLYLRSACASASASNEVACNDDHPDAGGTGSSIAVSDLPPGTYHLMVDTYSAAEMGEYTLTLNFGTCADADGDGICDVTDGCPADPDKPGPGQCGCGAPDTDGDGDGTADCRDACPADAGKVEPLACGCGVPEDDGDDDGTADCVDACPVDPSKTGPGACGCGVAEPDGDGDGAPNCVDDCPSDPAKTAPGACGCGVADADGDDDGALDCADECPSDAEKTAPGACGCGVADIDADGDGTLDCASECPDGAACATSGGGCGCSVGELGPATVSWHVALLLVVALGLGRRRQRAWP